MPVFDSRFEVAADVWQVAAFHFQPGALKSLCPPLTWMQVHQAEPLAEGSVTEFTMWMGPLPVYWKAVHSDVTVDGFTDTQEVGPLKTWVHTHRFRCLADHRTEVHDHIEYAHFGGWRGVRSRLLFSRPALRLLFAIRAQKTRRAVERAAET